MTASRIQRLRECHLYLVASVPLGADPARPPDSWWSAVEAAVAGGAGAVQLRAKGASTQALCHLAEEARGRLGPKVLLIVNDDLRAALSPCVDGLHLGRGDAEALAPIAGGAALRPPGHSGLEREGVGPTRSPIHAGTPSGSPHDPVLERRGGGLALARRRLGTERLLGASTRCLSEIQAARAGGADHVGFGAMLPSLTKPDSRRASPLELRLCTELLPDLPVFPIGGLGPHSLEPVLAAGVGRAAVGSALLEAGDPMASATELVRLLTRARMRPATRHPGPHAD